jgi:hypothetical protein
MYFQSLARALFPCTVRDPQTTLPIKAKVRRELMPSGFSVPFSSSVRV